jgi:hypothetical protein
VVFAGFTCEPTGAVGAAATLMAGDGACDAVGEEATVWQAITETENTIAKIDFERRMMAPDLGMTTYERVCAFVNPVIFPT